ncbi:TonB-dependent hemoglobin/transferrin/lactoferrin family receptor [Pseudomonadota bacterium]
MKTQLITSLAAALLALSSSVALAQDNNETDEETEGEVVELDTIVVVGGRIEQSLDDIAGSVSVMTSKDINEQMVTDMSQLFRYEPGIDVTGSNGTAQNFIVRGMGADRVMMIKDGMRMNEGYGADGLNDVVGRGFIDMDTVKQVEVAKGAASSLYGADAMGGIVAFSTKDAADVIGTGTGANTYFSVNGDYDGRADIWSAGGMAAFRTGKWETLLNYKYRDGHETQNYDETRANTDVTSNSVLAKTNYIIDNDKKLTFSIDYWLQEVEGPNSGENENGWLGLGPAYRINYEELYNEKENNAYRARYQDGDSSWAIMDSLDVNIYLNKSKQTDENLLNHEAPDNGPREILQSDLFEQETWGVSASASKLLGQKENHQLSYGFDWDTTDSYRPRSETRTDKDGNVIKDDLSAPFPKNTTDRLGVYLQDTIQLTDKWSLIPGLRYDYYKMTPKEDEGYENVNPGDEFPTEKISDSNVSWRLGTIYKFTDNISAYFQYAQGFKVPPYDLAYFYFDHVAFCDFAVFTCFGIRILPATDLVPEESDSYEIGIRGDIGNFSYNLSAYYNDYDNFIEVAYLGSVDGDYFGFPLVTDVFQYQNIDSARISGMEFRFDYYLGNNVSAFLNGEYMDSEDKTTGEQLRSIQPFNGTLGVNYYRGNFSTDVMMKWTDDMDKVPEGAVTTDGYITFDLFARYDVNSRLRLSAGILNMFNKEYIEYTSVAGIPDNGRDLTPFTQPGRTFSAQLKYIF